jgi:hypothetical protein
MLVSLRSNLLCVEQPSETASILEAFRRRLGLGVHTALDGAIASAAQVLQSAHQVSQPKAPVLQPSPQVSLPAAQMLQPASQILQPGLSDVTKVIITILHG